MDNNNLTIERFDCEEDLSGYTDSMLFCSGECIALMTVADNNGYTVQMQLEIQGDIAVRMLNSDDDYTRSPDDYSPEIRQAIEEGNYDALEVDLSNFFLMRYSILDSNEEEVDYDGDCFESDISKMSVEELKNSMLEYAENALDYYYQAESLKTSKQEKEEL